MLRSLLYFKQLNLAVVLGVAVAGATLTGALMVGDSVKASLARLNLDRLGAIDYAVVAGHHFEPRLATDLEAQIASKGYVVEPTLMLRGSARTEAKRASRVQITGIQAGFARLYPGGVPDLDPVLAKALEKEEGQVFPSVVVNEALATELGVALGDELVVAFPKPSAIHRDSLYGEKETEDVVEQMRVTVRHILADKGIGRFSMIPSQEVPFNAFVPLEALARSLGQEPMGNALLVGGAGVGTLGLDEMRGALDGVLTVNDLNLRLREGAEYLALETPGFFLSDTVAKAAMAAGSTMTVTPISTYLANSLVKGEQRVPYSLVSALPMEALLGPDSGLEGRIPTAAGEVVLNRWTADSLAAAIGDEIKMDYFVAGKDNRLTTATTQMKVVGILPMTGLGANRGLTPLFPGAEDAESMSAWDPTFPMDMKLIRPEDEVYWDMYHTSPKAFVTPDFARQLWASRFGFYTGLRFGLKADQDLAAAKQTLEQGLGQAFEPSTVGMDPMALRDQGKAASKGATDFTGLFIALSFFIIVSACLLIGLFFRLLVANRGTEAGILMAVGFARTRVRNRFLAEGMVLAVGGAVLGSVGGMGYAYALLAGMRRFWDLGTKELYFHFEPLSLAVGFVLTVLAALFSIWISVRLLKQFSLVALIGKVLSIADNTPSARTLWLFRLSAWGSLLGILGCVLWPKLAGLGFLAGSLLFVAGLSGLAVYLKTNRTLGLSTLGLAMRNMARQSGRTLVNATLVSVAVFTLVAVGLYRHAGEIDSNDPKSGAGGYFLAGEAEVPLHVALENKPELGTLGLGEELQTQLSQTETVSLRMRSGDDASCLNLFAPRQPRVLGVPDVARLAGRFPFQAHSGGPEADPWLLLEQDLPDGAIPVIGDLNSVMWILKSGLGKDYTIEDGLGRKQTLRFVGLLKGSLFQSELLVAERHFQALFPENSGYGYFLFGNAGSDRDGLLDLESELAGYGFDATTTAEKIKAYHAIENTYISIFQMLGALGLLLGTVGLGAVIYRNAIERRGELATLRAFGFQPARLRTLLILENTLVVVWGIGVGAVSAVVCMLPHLLTVTWDGSVPLLLATLAGVLLTSLLATAWAATHVARFPLLQDLRSE